jgi:hypothetical protein
MKQILRELNQKPIAYYPVYRKLTGSTTGGILLSQLMYWFSKKDKIFKIDREIMEETLLTEKELKNAKKLIKNLDFITVSREGLPAKTYYEIDWEKFENCLKDDDETVQTSDDETDKQDCPNGPNSMGQKVQTYIVKSLTENTTEKKSKKKIFTSDDLSVAQYLFEKIKAIYAGAKEPNWEEWANNIRLLREQDGKSLEAIRNVIDMIFEDKGVWDGSFWRRNIRSTAKLRKQYEQIAYQISLAYKSKGAA